MNIIYAIILGMIEGITEFIPISSTAHMLIAQSILNIPSSEVVFAFLVIIQLGPLAALLLFFWKDYLILVRAFFAKPFSTFDNRMAWYILIATLPALVAAFFLRDIIQTLFQHPLSEAAIRLLVAAVLLFIGEWLGRKTRQLKSITWIDSIVIGLFQVLAVFPGSSRSGATIPGGMLRNFDRPSATRFAFLMAAPIMLASGLYETLGVIRLHLLGNSLLPFIVGFVVSAVVGWMAIQWMLRYVSKHSLYLFSAYCAILGGILLISIYL